MRNRERGRKNKRKKENTGMEIEGTKEGHNGDKKEIRGKRKCNRGKTK